MTVVVRPGRLDEPAAVEMTAEVQRWYVEVYGGQDRDPAEPDAFAPPRGGFRVAELDREPVGMGGWTRDGDDAKVRRMYVRPAARRRGVAAAVLDALEADALTAGATRMLLSTGTPQVAAIALYRARGYTEVPAFGFHAGGALAVFLAKPLPPAPGS